MRILHPPSVGGVRRQQKLQGSNSLYTFKRIHLYDSLFQRCSLTLTHTARQARAAVQSLWVHVRADRAPRFAGDRSGREGHLRQHVVHGRCLFPHTQARDSSRTCAGHADVQQQGRQPPLPEKQAPTKCSAGISAKRKEASYFPALLPAPFLFRQRENMAASPLPRLRSLASAEPDAGAAAPAGSMGPDDPAEEELPACQGAQGYPPTVGDAAAPAARLAYVAPAASARERERSPPDPAERAETGGVVTSP